MDPGGIATALYSLGLIDRLNYQKATLTNLAPLERSQDLLSVVDARIASDEGAFDTFLFILSQDPVMEEICRLLWQTRGRQLIIYVYMTCYYDGLCFGCVKLKGLYRCYFQRCYQLCKTVIQEILFQSRIHKMMLQSRMKQAQALLLTLSLLQNPAREPNTKNNVKNFSKT